MFQGLRTVIYKARDIEKVRDWYAEILGIQPYFDQPFYVGFNVGGYELGLDPNAPPAGNAQSNGHIAYWGVDNAEASLKRLLEAGATQHGPIQDVGDGIRMGLVVDPSGNLLGFIENPHFSLPNQS